MWMMPTSGWHRLNSCQVVRLSLTVIMWNWTIRCILGTVRWSAQRLFRVIHSYSSCLSWAWASSRVRWISIIWFLISSCRWVLFLVISGLLLPRFSFGTVALEIRSKEKTASGAMTGKRLLPNMNSKIRRARKQFRQKRRNCLSWHLYGLITKRE